MFGKIVLALSIVALVGAQVPSLGFCPDYVPMANFDMTRFLGVWYEAERYFQLTEVVSRCVTANYTKGPDGKYRVSNEVTNRFTGVKRILEGEIKKAASKAEEGKLYVKYTIPLTPETKYSVLETDYDSYAVLWSCSGFGPFHTQNAWLMTRERLAPGTVLQKAYGVLDKYKISKSFFVKTDQDDCAFLEAPAAQVAADKPAEAAQNAPAVAEPEEAAHQNDGNVRSAVAAVAEEPVDETREENAMPIKKDEEVPAVPEVVKDETKEVKLPVETLPERILKVADAVKEEILKDEQPVLKTEEEMAASEMKTEKVKDLKEVEKTA